MKNIFLIPVLFLLMITACSKSDDAISLQNQTTEKYRLQEARYSNGTIYRYEYNTTGKLSKIFTNGSLTNSYNYDSQDRLIQNENTSSSYQYYFKNYTYTGANLKPDESITQYKVVGDAQETKNRDVYLFNNDLLTEYKSYYWNASNNTYSSPVIYKYEYDNNKKLIKLSISSSNYILFTNDTNGNTTVDKQFELKSGSTTEYYMWRSVTQTYDTKKNILSNLYPNPLGNSDNNFGNVLDRTKKDFNESGNTTDIASSSIIYEYNEAGYPTKAIENGNTTVYILEKYSN
jgi:YD repeat-containing protein